MSTGTSDTRALAVASGEVLAADARARRRHYGVFYGLDTPPDGAGVVLGNCQAESVRIVLDGAETPTVRVPPVHEMTAEDLPHLDRLLSRARFVVAQPVRDDYRGLPLGTRQVSGRVGPGCRVVRIPSVRFAGLHPFQAAVRVPGVVEDPPIVAYHDVRELGRAAEIALPERLPPSVVRRIAAGSVEELRRREREADTVVVSDVFARPCFALARTVNHPGNPVFLALGERVLETLGVAAAPTDPGRPLLSGVVAPREPWVVDAWGLDAEPDGDWTIAGARVAAGEVGSAHAAWYRRHPDAVRAVVSRLADLVGVWRSA